MPVSSPSNGSVGGSENPQADAAWELMVSLINALEVAIQMDDQERAQQIWIPLQATNSDLLSFWAYQIGQITTPGGGA